MENTEDYSIKIANYLDDAMPASEEEAFMEELSSNEALRKQFEDELLVRDLLNENAQSSSSTSHLPLQPADEHVAMPERAFDDQAGQKEQAPVISMLRNYRMMAAAVAGVIVAALIVVFLIYKKNRSEMVAEANTPKSSNTGIDSTKQKVQPLPSPQVQAPVFTSDSIKGLQPNLAENKKGDSAYRLFYEPYISKMDPPEVDNYYQAYRKGNYAKVLAAKDADVQLMGPGDREEVLKRYLHLYKGLSWLAENKPLQSVKQFNLVLNTTVKKDVLFYKAQWYCALAWLKAGDIEKALALLKNISNSSSPYAAKSVRVINMFNTH